jgi:hypothetical protein
MVMRTREKFVTEGLDAVLARKKHLSPPTPPIFDGEAQRRRTAGRSRAGPSGFWSTTAAKQTVSCGSPPASSKAWSRRHRSPCETSSIAPEPVAASLQSKPHRPELTGEACLIGVISQQCPGHLAATCSRSKAVLGQRLRLWDKGRGRAHCWPNPSAQPNNHRHDPHRNDHLLAVCVNICARRKCEHDPQSNK